MEIQKKTLVLVTRGLAQRSLGIVVSRNDMTADVCLIEPRKQCGELVVSDLGDVMPIAEDIEPEDIGEKIAPVLHRLADTQYCQKLVLGLADKMASIANELRKKSGF